MKRKRKKKFPVAVAAAGFRDLHSQPLAPTVLTRLRVDPGKVSTRTCGRAKARVTAVSGICARLNWDAAVVQGSTGRSCRLLVFYAALIERAATDTMSRILQLVSLQLRRELSACGGLARHPARTICCTARRRAEERWVSWGRRLRRKAADKRSGGAWGGHRVRSWLT